MKLNDLTKEGLKTKEVLWLACLNGCLLTLFGLVLYCCTAAWQDMGEMKRMGALNYRVKRVWGEKKQKKKERLFLESFFSFSLGTGVSKHIGL